MSGSGRTSPDEAATPAPAWGGRILFAACALGILAVGVERAPIWLSNESVLGFAQRAAVVLGAAAVCLWVTMRGRAWSFKRMALEAVLFAAMLLAVDFVMEVWAPRLPSAQLTRAYTARKLAIPFDTHTLSQVVEQLRANGVDALPGTFGGWAQIPQVRADLPPGFYPLSHASHATVVECNEEGRYLRYRSDAHGFNNPEGMSDRRDLDIAVVGESFALGHCIRSRDSLVGNLRRAYPRTVNFGIAGNGSLQQLATFREYVEPLRPRLVLWTTNPTYLAADLQDPLLQRYWDPSFSQHLRERQGEVDLAERKWAIAVQRERDEGVLSKLRARRGQRARRILTLADLRERAGSTLREQFGLRVVQHRRLRAADLHPFIRSVVLAQRTTQAWGGRFIVVLVPSYFEVVEGSIEPALRHDPLAHALRAAGVTVIDGTALFMKQHDPPSLYTMRINNHPTREGYAFLGNEILQRLYQGPQRLLATH